MLKSVKLLVGLPGSGKTTLGDALVKASQGSVMFIDDLRVPSAEKYLRKLDLKGISTLIIADVYFCQTSTREAAVKVIQKIFPEAAIEILFFENSVPKCLSNVEKRKLSGDDRKVEGLIKLLSRDYVIPANSIVIEINTKV